MKAAILIVAILTFGATGRAALLVSPTALSFNYYVGGPPPPSQFVSIQAGSTSSFTATVSYGTWLNISKAPSGGINVGLSFTSFRIAGVYSTTIVVSAPGETSQQIAVTATIRDGTSPPPSIAGTWLLTGSYSGRTVFTATMLIAQTGNTLSGQITSSGTSCPPTAAFTGTITPPFLQAYYSFRISGPYGTSGGSFALTGTIGQGATSPSSTVGYSCGNGSSGILVLHRGAVSLSAAALKFGFQPGGPRFHHNN